MRGQDKHFYEFGAYRIDARDHLLLRDGELVPLAPKAFDLLLVFVENSGRVLSKEDLMKQVWPDSFVEEANLSHHVFTLRKALGEDSEGRYIETIPRRGYRFVAGVTEMQDDSDELVVAEHSRSRIVMEHTEAPILTLDYRGPERTSRVLGLTAGNRPRTVLLALVCAVVLVLAVVIYFWRAGKTGEQTAAVKSIAVLPFKPLVADSHDEYLELGMADTLITRLSSLKQLVVRPTSAVRKYTDVQQDALVAGRQLQVESILDGGIQRLGDRLRVTVRLINVNDGATLWADTFDERFTDIFAVQDAISRRLAGVLALKLSGDDKKLLEKHYTANTEAYQLYLKGRYFWNKRTGDGLREAIKYFGQAIEMDSNYGLAYAGIADCYVLLGNDGELPGDEGYSRAKAAAIRALEIDDRLAEAHTSLAFALAGYHQNSPDAEPEFKRSLELNPNYATGHHWYGLYLYGVGRPEEALSEMKRAKDLDPLSLVINAELGWAFVWVGQYDQAIEQLQKTLEMDGNFIRTHQVLGLVYLRRGQYEQAIAEYERARQLNGDTNTLVHLGYAYAVAGRRSEAQKTLGQLIELEKLGRVLPSEIAMVYMGLGNIDRAFAWLEKSYATHENLSFIKVNSEFERLRSDPRYAALLERAGLAP